MYSAMSRCLPRQKKQTSSQGSVRRGMCSNLSLVLSSHAAESPLFSSFLLKGFSRQFASARSTLVQAVYTIVVHYTRFTSCQPLRQCPSSPLSQDNVTYYTPTVHSSHIITNSQTFIAAALAAIAQVANGKVVIQPAPTQAQSTTPAFQKLLKQLSWWHTSHWHRRQCFLERSTSGPYSTSAPADPATKVLPSPRLASAMCRVRNQLSHRDSPLPLEIVRMLRVRW